MSTKKLLTDMISLFAEGNQQKAKDVFHQYTQLKMRHIIEATTSKQSRFTDDDTRKLAGARSVGNAKAVVKGMIEKSASKQTKKQQLLDQLEKCTTVAQCQSLGYNVLLKGEGKGVIKESVEDEQRDCPCVDQLDAIDTSLPTEDIIKAIVDIAADTPEITVAHISDILDQIEGVSGEEAIELAKQVFIDATMNHECDSCDTDDTSTEATSATDDASDFNPIKTEADEIIDGVADDVGDMDDLSPDHITGDDINDEEFEELDLPEPVQTALDSVEDEDARQIIEDAVIEFFESGMDEGELADQVEDFDHLITGVLAKCHEDCDDELTQIVSDGLDSVKMAMFGDADGTDDLDVTGNDDLETEVDREDEPGTDRKLGDLVSAKRVGVGSI